MSERKRYLHTGDVVVSTEVGPDTQFVLLDTHPPGSMSEITYDDQNQACLEVPGLLLKV